MSEISVIVPAKNAEATLPRLIAALRAQEVEVPFEVLIVDDGSVDQTREIAERAGAPFRAIAAEGPGGAGAARNTGAGRSSALILAFTDADCMPDPGWLAAGLRALASAEFVQGAVRPDARADRSSPYHRTLEVNCERGFYETANVLVTRDLFERLGGFQDWLPAVGGRPQGEDTLFGWSARRAGVRVAFSADAVVEHAVLHQSRRAWIRDRWRWQVLPALVKRVPEMRRQTLYRRVFFEHRTAAFDVALVGLVTALATRRRLPLVLSVRYLSLVVEEASRIAVPECFVYPVIRLVADSVSCVALTLGSVRARNLVI